MSVSGPISSWRGLRERQLVPQPDGHVRLVPWRELRPHATAKFRTLYERKHRRFAALWHSDECVWTRRTMEVSTRKYKARRKRK